MDIYSLWNLIFRTRIPLITSASIAFTGWVWLSLKSHAKRSRFDPRKTIYSQEHLQLGRVDACRKAATCTGRSGHWPRELQHRSWRTPLEADPHAVQSFAQTPTTSQHQLEWKYESWSCAVQTKNWSLRQTKQNGPYHACLDLPWFALIFLDLYR